MSATHSPSPQALQPQLRMRHALKVRPLNISLPARYVLRGGTRADDAALAQILSAAFNETWSHTRVCEALFDDKSVDRTFIIEHDGEAVATASYQVRSEPNPRAGWVHWVACLPSHGGKKLGLIATIAVVDESIRRQRPEVYLQTDDFRLPAIASYLACGFEPDPWHETHPARWSKVRESLAQKR